MSAIAVAVRHQNPVLELHRRRAKKILNARITKRVPYPVYLGLVDLIATFKVESDTAPMTIRVITGEVEFPNLQLDDTHPGHCACGATKGHEHECGW